MVGAISSLAFTPFSFSQRENLQVGHDHTPDGCTFCQSRNAKTATSSHDSRGTLTPEEQKQVEELKNRDREVRAHEQAHLASAGGYARGGASFSYQKGPDGKSYAVGGEVPIDLSPIAHNPQATLQKAETIQRAALAPAEPSGQDRQVAAQAAALATQARQEAAQLSQETTSTSKNFTHGRLSPVAIDTKSSSTRGHSQETGLPPSHPLFSAYLPQKQGHTPLPPGSLVSVIV